MTFNTRIYRQQGGSEMTVASGGSLNFEAGGRLGGAPTIGAGAALTVETGGSLNLYSGVSGTAIQFAGQGASTPSLGWGPNVPTHSAPMGSLYLRANGSISGLFINITQDAAGSTWRLHQQGSAIG